MTSHSLLSLSLASLVLVLAGCAQKSQHDPIGRHQIGTNIHRTVDRAESEGYLDACTGADIEDAREAVRNWVDAMAHIDHCEVGKARYYSQPEVEFVLAHRLREAAAGADAACRAQIGRESGRLQRTFQSIRAYVHAAPGQCGDIDLLNDIQRQARSVYRDTDSLSERNSSYRARASR